jgi:hypothetical protein
MAAALLAYQAATHSGLTQRAALSSRLGETLRAWGLSGLYHEIRLPLQRLPRTEAFRMRERLSRVDPAWGGAADPQGAQRVLGWLVAGSVLEEAPASRGRHHFLDPRDGSGLIQPRPGLEWVLSAIASVDGEGSLSGALSGTNFGTIGEPADRWIMFRENEWGIPAFHGELRKAILSQEPWQREGAMARALLALGSVLHVLQDMASPTHVRNDLWEGHLARADGSAFDRSSRYEHWVAVAHGQLVPPPAAPPPPQKTTAYFRSLAEDTQRDFLSPGSLPLPLHLAKGMSQGQAEQGLRAGSAFPIPPLSGVDFRREFGYLRGPAAEHLVAYRIDARGTLRTSLNEACFADYARALLPRAGAATIALLHHLARPGPTLRITDRSVTIDPYPDARSGEVVLFWEDASGLRHELARHPMGTTDSFSIPPAAVRIGLLVEGLDAHGERLVTARVVDRR